MRARRRRWGNTQWFLLCAFVVLVVGVVQGGIATQLKDERTINVVFHDGFGPADVQRVRTTCAALPGVAPLPPPRADKASSRRYPLRVSISGTDAAQVAAFIECLQRDGSVLRFAIENEPGN